MNRLTRYVESLTDEARLLWILGVGTVLRFISITHSSIWHDEGYTMMIAPRGFAQITADTIRDVHPPLYYYFLHVWLQVFGSSELAARSMSAVFSLGTVAVVFFLARRLFSRNIAAIAALFTALAPFMIRYSQEARMYAMIAFFTTAATYALVRAMEHPRRHRLWWVLYAVLMLASVYTQYFGFFVLMVHWIYVGIRTVLQPGSHGVWQRIKSFLAQGWWWAANAVILLGFLPWIPILINQLTRVNNSFWIQPQWITLNTVPDTVYTFFAYIHLDSPFPQFLMMRDLPFALILLLMGWAIWLWRSKFKDRAEKTSVPTTWRESGFLLLYFLLPLALVWTVSQTPPTRLPGPLFSICGCRVLHRACVRNTRFK